MNANLLFDTLKREGAMRFDVELARVLKINPTELSRMRRAARELGPAMILRVHEKTGMSVKRIRSLLASQDVAARMAETQKPTSFVHRCL